MLSRVHALFSIVLTRMLIWYSIAFSIQFLYGLIFQHPQAFWLCFATAGMITALSVKTNLPIWTSLLFAILANYFLPVSAFLYLIHLEDEDLLLRWDLFRDTWNQMYAVIQLNFIFSAFLLIVSLLLSHALHWFLTRRSGYAQISQSTDQSAEPAIAAQAKCRPHQTAG